MVPHRPRDLQDHLLRHDVHLGPHVPPSGPSSAARAHPRGLRVHRPRYFGPVVPCRVQVRGRAARPHGRTRRRGADGRGAAGRYPVHGRCLRLRVHRDFCDDFRVLLLGARGGDRIQGKGGGERAKLLLYGERVGRVLVCNQYDRCARVFDVWCGDYLGFFDRVIRFRGIT